jgi:preprotein translocase subunit YajC
VLIAADTAAGGGGNIWGTVAMFAVLFGLMYLMFIRPQSRRRREAQEMQSKLGSGDKVITIGGLYGTVESADDESVILEISPGVTARYARQAIARITERAGGDEPDTSADESEHEPASSPIQETKKVK